MVVFMFWIFFDKLRMKDLLPSSSAFFFVGF